MFVDNSVSEARITRQPDGAYYFSATGFQSHKMRGFGEHIVWFLSYLKTMFTNELRCSLFSRFYCFVVYAPRLVMVALGFAYNESCLI